MRNDALTTKTQVAFSWSAPPDDGGSTVLDYSIEMDDNDDGAYDSVATGVTQASHTESGLSTGNPHKFRVRARNAVGFSNYSSVFTIISATVPAQLSAPTTALHGGDTQVIIDWSAPADLGGLSIDGYKVVIKTSTNSFAEDLTNCDAETDTGIISATRCSIPVATLRASPFDLSDTDPVVAKVTAFNALGDSDESAEGNGASMPNQ